jgi:hypothetical protein
MLLSFSLLFSNFDWGNILKCLGFFFVKNMLFKIVLGWGYIVHLQKFLQYIKYLILEFTAPTIPFSYIPSPSIPGTV